MHGTVTYGAQDCLMVLDSAHCRSALLADGSRGAAEYSQQGELESLGSPDPRLHHPWDHGRPALPHAAGNRTHNRHEGAAGTW